MKDFRRIITKIRITFEAFGLDYVQDNFYTFIHVYDEQVLEYLYSIGVDIEKPGSSRETPFERCCVGSPKAITAEWFLSKGAHHVLPFYKYMITWGSPHPFTFEFNFEGFGLHPFFKRGLYKEFGWENLPDWIRDIYGPLEALVFMAIPLTLRRLGRPLWNLDILRSIRKYVRE